MFAGCPISLWSCSMCRISLCRRRTVTVRIIVGRTKVNRTERGSSMWVCRPRRFSCAGSTLALAASITSPWFP
jgi:hypothetical protein